MSLNLRKESSFSFKSPSDTSNTRPLRPSEAISSLKQIEMQRTYFLKKKEQNNKINTKKKEER